MEKELEQIIKTFGEDLLLWGAVYDIVKLADGQKFAYKYVTLRVWQRFCDRNGYELLDKTTLKYD